MRVLPLRPHHGMCLAYYKGHGYSPAFCRRMEEMLTALTAGMQVRLTVSTDCICQACPNRRGTACITEEKVARFDRDVLRACALAEGETLPFRAFAQQVQRAILETGQRERICGDCQWNSLCTGSSRWESI